METYRLPRTIEAQLQARARRTGRSVAQVARDAVLDGIDAIEGYYLAVEMVREQQREAAHAATVTGTRGATAHISS